MKNRIYIQDWLDLKPYDKQVTSDHYYLNLANEIHDALREPSIAQMLLSNYLDEEDFKFLSSFLTSYFEDLITGTNLWPSFIKMHEDHYGKKIPFYAYSDYEDDEINPQDVAFLIWYFINSISEDAVVWPLNDFIINAGNLVYDILDEHWEYAPENEDLKSIYSLPDDADFYQARNLIDLVLFKSYLFHTDTAMRLLAEELRIIETNKHEDIILDMLHEARDQTLHSSRTRLLALKGKDWAAAVVGSEHALYHDLKHISQKISGLFLYKGQDEADVFIEHIASGKNFKMTKASFDHYEELNEADLILFLSIVRWKSEWWFSGVYFKKAFDADLILDEKNSIKKRMETNFLDLENYPEKFEEIINSQEKAFLEFNKGAQIAFLNSSDLDNFIQGYRGYYNDTLQLSEKDSKKALKRARKEGLFLNQNNEIEGLSDHSENALVFFNPKSGIEVAHGINNLFPLDINPQGKDGFDGQDFIELLVFEEFSPELVKYCLSLWKNSDNEILKKREPYLKELDFLLRYWKGSSYYSIPQITLAGLDRE